MAGRLDVSGARWGLHGADAVLKLRTIVANGIFTDYWHHHLAEEHQRVDHARGQHEYDLAA
ncbi:hypothetical protein ACFQHO_19365 [Actinomadura yumaensis]|uniref:hypothetical protein n=1 Tax=Actinomadura TaxID=1988 RepID=UPI001327BAE9|nr:hypothetical protein [Actinomadura sp. J1-007]